jgi:hypothetical protein
MKLMDRLKSHPKTTALNRRLELVIELALEKTAGHLLQPSKYPLPQDAKSTERALFSLLNSLPKRRQKKFTARYEARLNMTAAQRKNYYGDLAGINLKLARSLEAQLKELGAPAEQVFGREDAQQVESIVKTHVVPPTRKGKIVKRRAVAKVKTAQPAAPVIASRLNFSMNSLTCVKKSEVTKDEINVSAFATDSGQNQQDRGPFFVGKFKKGQTIDLGAKALLFTLDVIDDSVGGFPATFTASAFLIEEDWIHNRDLSNKLSIVCFAIYGLCMVAMSVIITVGFLGGPVTVVMAYLAIAVGLTFLIIGAQLLPAITDDVSGVATDTLVLEALPAVGDRFDREMEFEVNNSNFDPTSGAYKAAVSWEVVAV